MRTIPALLVGALLAACGPAEEAAPAMDEVDPGPTLADFAGTWENMAMLEGTPDPVPSTMTSSADGSDWTMSLAGRDAISMEVSMVGDSLIAETAEYESVLREGVMVTVRTASVLSDGMLVGTLVATYTTADGMETVTGTMQGTRAGN